MSARQRGDHAQDGGQPANAARAVVTGSAAFVVVVCLALAGGAIRLRLERAPGEPARVTRVVDGDTLAMEDGETVRVLGIDTPETHHPDLAPQPFGEEAARRTAQLVLEGRIGLEMDAEPRDSYGRLLAHVWIGKRLLAEVLAEEGLGRELVIPPNTMHAARIRAAEGRARSASRGIWLAEATPIPAFRRQ